MLCKRSSNRSDMATAVQQYHLWRPAKSIKMVTTRSGGQQKSESLLKLKAAFNFVRGLLWKPMAINSYGCWTIIDDNVHWQPRLLVHCSPQWPLSVVNAFLLYAKMPIAVNCLGTIAGVNIYWSWLGWNICPGKWPSRYGVIFQLFQQWLLIAWSGVYCIRQCPSIDNTQNPLGHAMATGGQFLTLFQAQCSIIHSIVQGIRIFSIDAAEHHLSMLRKIIYRSTTTDVHCSKSQKSTIGGELQQLLQLYRHRSGSSRTEPPMKKIDLEFESGKLR